MMNVSLYLWTGNEQNMSPLISVRRDFAMNEQIIFARMIFLGFVTIAVRDLQMIFFFLFNKYQVVLLPEPNQTVPDKCQKFFIIPKNNKFTKSTNKIKHVLTTEGTQTLPKLRPLYS